ncbi:glycosyltransferase [Sphingobium sp. H39-3-25]|uniref:glycosyltransferase family 2 protein n=1 Tax=Sphingobium arseniciresistens TaxID=3030834 RepID=UPI0023B92DC4|nr:glycosyltransferase [Sphingobium arseniciresistens]
MAATALSSRFVASRPMSLSVLTIVKNRGNHFAQLVEGLRRSIVTPDELIVVDMGSAPALRAPDAPFPIELISLNRGGLPLAAARNAAAQAAAGEHLLFLDVDCIPMRGLVGEMRDQLTRDDGLICAEALYLGPRDARDGWEEEDLKLSAKPHPVRSFPAEGIREETNAGLFWSLVFGIRRQRFIQLGGFDESFTGYGAEDTDFGFRARRAGTRLLFKGGGAGAFHQHHDVFDPPLQHLEDIVRNAQLFHDRWHVWPMEGWLDAFSQMGLIAWAGDRLILRRTATTSELSNARRS